MHKKLFPCKSLTKNWPGGRRKALVLSSISHGGSAYLWRDPDYKDPEPYLSQGGMADPNTSPLSIGSSTNDLLHNTPGM